MTLETIRLIIWSIDAIVCGVWLYAMYRRSKRRVPCDSCKKLVWKGNGTVFSRKYRCEQYGSLDAPPQICRAWERKRKGGRVNER